MTEYPVSLERINKYLDLTSKALVKVSIIDDVGTDNYAKAQDIIEMVKAYHKWSEQFRAL